MEGRARGKKVCQIDGFLTGRIAKAVGRDAPMPADGYNTSFFMPGKGSFVYSLKIIGDVVKTQNGLYHLTHKHILSHWQ